MRFGEYLYAKAVTLCFLGIGTLFLDIFLAFCTQCGSGGVGGFMACGRFFD